MSHIEVMCPNQVFYNTLKLAHHAYKSQVLRASTAALPCCSIVEFCGIVCLGVHFLCEAIEKLKD